MKLERPITPTRSQQEIAERSLRSPVFAPGAFFGYFQLIGRVRTPKDAPYNRRVIWRVRCVCKKELKIPEYYMRRKSQPRTHCGCQNKSLKTLYNREYRIWLMMHKRCYDSTHIAYKHYGGRGITVHPDWHRDIAGIDRGFEAFLNHIGPAPTNKHSVDRIDNDKGYEPNNVRWATDVEQAQNKRRTK